MPHWASWRDETNQGEDRPRRSSLCFRLLRHITILVLGCIAITLQAEPVPFRVCADPNNMPYSNRQQQGFENRLAQIVAKDLGRSLSYFWFPQRENFFDGL